MNAETRGVAFLHNSAIGLGTYGHKQTDKASFCRKTGLDRTAKGLQEYSCAYLGDAA